MTEQEELELLKQKSPYALPDNPSQSGWSTDQIKRKHYEGLFFLYDLFKQQRTTIASDVAAMQLIIDNINDEYAAIISGEAVKAKYDIDNNEIKNTYAKILDITNGTIGALKFIRENNTTAFIYTIEDNLNTLTTAFNSLKLWTDALRNENGNEAVLRAVQATKDSLGNVIKDTYATVTSVTLLNTAITNIINGTTTVSKAYNDQNGDRIDTTYLKIANIVNALNDTSTNKALSAAKGKALQDQIDAINTLLASDTTTLDTLQEIVDYIKNNKDLIDGITVTKMSFTDLVKNLTTNNDNLPLAASQGYALKAMIDAINDVEDGIEAAEALRVIAENARVLAEETRAAFYEGFNTALNGKEDKTNKVTSLSSSSTDTEYPSAKVVYDGLALKANQATTYTKTENDAQLDLKADKSTTYTKTETDTLVNGAKTYTDKKIKKMYMDLGHNDISTSDYEGLVYQITAPSGAKLLQLQSIGGNTVKLSPSVASDSTKAMIKTMPSTVYTFDGSKFYGDSKVSENLLVLNDVAETTYLGITYKVQNGIIYLSGLSQNEISLYFTINERVLNGTYYYYVETSGTTSSSLSKALRYGTANVVNISDNTTISVSNRTTNRLLIYIPNATTITNYVYKPMLVSGSTAPTEWKQGFSGIHNIELTGLKVEGANLFDKSIANINKALNVTNGYLFDSSEYMTSDYIAVIPNTQYSDNVSSIQFNICYYDKNKTFISGQTKATPYTIPSGAYYIRIQAYKTRLDTFMIVKGSTTPTTYQPYITPTTLPIDLTSIEDSGGNKLFADGKLRLGDYITPYSQLKGRKQVETNDDWNYGSNGAGTLYIISQKYTATTTTDIISTNKVVSQYAWWNMETPSEITVTFDSNSGGLVIIPPSDLQTVANIIPQCNIEALLRTPLTSNTDLSATLRNIQSYPNGSIIAENTHNMDVESLITYNSIIQETLCPSITITRNGVDILTRNLPTQASDGWSAGTSRNYRVFCDDEGNAVNKRENNVYKNSNMATYNWSYTSGDYPRFYTEQLEDINTSSGNYLCDKYTYVSENTITGDNIDMTFTVRSNGRVMCKNLSYTDTNTFTKFMTNEPLYYELADTSKTETDMDDFDFFFDVEEGDVITFNNPYAQQVYATYSFLIKEAKSNE